MKEYEYHVNIGALHQTKCNVVTVLMTFT